MWVCDPARDCGKKRQIGPPYRIKDLHKVALMYNNSVVLLLPHNYPLSQEFGWTDSHSPELPLLLLYLFTLTKIILLIQFISTNWKNYDPCVIHLLWVVVWAHFGDQFLTRPFGPYFTALLPYESLLWFLVFLYMLRVETHSTMPDSGGSEGARKLH